LLADLQHQGYDPDQTISVMVQAVRQALPMILYMCSANAEMHSDRTGETSAERKPALARDKKGNPVFAQPADPEQIQVGYRIGAKLEKAREQERKDHAASGRTVSPHLRRAHFHGFWTGARNSVERKLLVKWVAPVLVGIEQGELLPTFREVK
jgi:hypothetical protein